MSERNDAALGGLVFATLSIVALAVMPPPPAGDASAATVRAYFAEHSTAIRVASVLSILGALGLLALVSLLRRRLPGTAADVLYAGGLVTTTVAVVGGVLQAGLAQSQPRLADTGLLASFGIERMVFYAAPPLGMTAVAAAAAIAFRGVWPSWLAMGSAVLAAVALVGGILNVVTDTGAGGVVGLAGFVLTIVWAASTAVVALRRPAQTPTTASAGMLAGA